MNATICNPYAKKRPRGATPAAKIRTNGADDFDDSVIDWGNAMRAVDAATAIQGLQQTNSSASTTIHQQ